jgi:cell division protein FtsB
VKDKLLGGIRFGKNYVERLRDVRVLGLHVFIVIALLVTWNSVGVIQANYELQQKLSRIQQENELQKLENDTLALRNEYFETDQYLELAARKQFNKGEPGETVVLVPKEVALKHAAPPLEIATPEQTAPRQPQYQQNFEAWIEFFFRRGVNEAVPTP